MHSAPKMPKSFPLGVKSNQYYIPLQGPKLCKTWKYFSNLSGEIFLWNSEKNWTGLPRARVGLIWSTLRYQFWSGTSERTMSEDSKNVFEISVAIIQTRHGPLKATASTVYYSIEAQNLTTLDFVEIEIFLYKSSMLNIIQKKLHQYLL